MLKELLELTSTAIVLCNTAAMTTNTALVAVDNVVAASELSTRVLKKEAQNMIKWHDIRLSDQANQQALVIQGLDV